MLRTVLMLSSLFPVLNSFSQQEVTLKIVGFSYPLIADTNILKIDSLQSNPGLEYPDYVMPFQLVYPKYKTPSEGIDPLTLEIIHYLSEDSYFLGLGIIAELKPNELTDFWEKWRVSVESTTINLQIDSVKLMVYRNKVGEKMTLVGSPDNNQFKLLCSLQNGDFVSLESILYKVKGQTTIRSFNRSFFITVGPYQKEKL